MIVLMFVCVYEALEGNGFFSKSEVFQHTHSSPRVCACLSVCTERVCVRLIPVGKQTCVSKLGAHRCSQCRVSAVLLHYI